MIPTINIVVHILIMMTRPVMVTNDMLQVEELSIQGNIQEIT